jgi:hypothetical protein
MLCLIIFLWTPPHFWALALYRAEDYRQGRPADAADHARPEFTRLQVLLYTFVLFAATLLPFVHRMSGWIYLAAAVVLGAAFHPVRLAAVARLQRRPGAADLPLLDLAPVAAVRGAAGRPLPGTMAAPTRRLILAAAAASMLAACDRLGGGAAPSFKGIDITGADYAKELNLLDADGKPRTLADFKGKVTVVFFGYTQCPDVCPTTLAELAAARKLLGADGAGCRVCSSPSTPSATARRS